MKKRNQIIPEIMRIPILLSLACNMIAYYGSRLLVVDRKHYNLSNRLDEQIPFVPWTIIIYWGCYVFWIVNYVIGCRPTLTTRQYVFADVIAGVALSELCWLFVKKSGFTRRYMDIMAKADIRMARRRRLCEQKN